MPDNSRTDRMKIDVAQLTIGMYVTELDRPWTETSFLFQGFRIRHQQEIRLLEQVCKHVWVDSRRSVGIKQQVIENHAQSPELQPIVAKVDFNQEVEQASPVWHKAHEESLRILDAVRMGQELDVSAVKAVVRECVQSILRNPPPCSGWPASRIATITPPSTLCESPSSPSRWAGSSGWLSTSLSKLVCAACCTMSARSRCPTKY
ncbi:DUF3391 domain-containing protein [Pseudomonas neustonica]|uniref:DUF3391 domain-containing protein n=1 Tax=Pseudomonas neustonica TaxID=2487346 RepID=UPI003F6DE85B